VHRAGDERIGQLLRSIRREARFTQTELADSAGIPVGDVIAIEAGRLGQVKVDRLREAFAVFDARVRVSAWWRGAWADQLLDAAHAALVETTASIFARRGWHCIPEFSFAEFGERGSIDLFAAHEPGFRPEHVGRLLIVPDTSATRAVVRRHETTMGLIYPERSRAIRRWIRTPRGPMAGIWFLSNLGNREPVTG
jgi:transcriptional regulator with XRE-family HTH domain